VHKVTGRNNTVGHVTPGTEGHTAITPHQKGKSEKELTKLNGINESEICKLASLEKTH